MASAPRRIKLGCRFAGPVDAAKIAHWEYMRPVKIKDMPTAAIEVTPKLTRAQRVPRLDTPEWVSPTMLYQGS